MHFIRVNIHIIIFVHNLLSQYFALSHRSVQMRLYTLTKRQFVMVFAGFFICFGITLIIGIAGMSLFIFLYIMMLSFNMIFYTSMYRDQERGWYKISYENLTRGSNMQMK